MAMKEPVCLIESDSDGRLRMVPSALKILEQIEQKVVVVSVVGLFRTGKSYLMNRLAGANKGFPLGSSIQAKTKGIWMWCVPHPRKTDHTLVLLDTEGLGDVEKGDAKHDNWIFAMAVLLSSTLVYNSMGVIDSKSMENLHYVTELTKHIKIKSNTDEEDDRTYARYTPSFVWAVRDFSLELEIDGKPITADEYLENGLKEKQGKEYQRYNEPRACIRKFFWPRSCFVFERPGKPKIMKEMEELTDADLDPDFVEQTKTFTEHIYTKSETKFVGDGMKVTGKMFGQLAEMYVKAIRSGEVPCLENAVKALAEIENARAVEQARVLYAQRMKILTSFFPNNTLEELSTIHASSEREALSLFTKHSVRDDNQEYQMKLLSVLQGEYNRICEKNFNESRKACEQIIKQVFEPLENNLGAGLYTVLGGYKTFCQDLQTMADKYRCAEGKGVKAEEMLKTYLDEKAIVGKAILAADKRLSEAQQREEELKKEREEAERQKRAMAEQQKILDQKIADQKRSQEEMSNSRQASEEAMGFLLRSMWEFDIRGEACPGELLVYGSRAFPIGTDRNGRVFLAGAYHGQGRVIVFTHESYMGRQELAPFLHNALHWLDKGRRGLVGVQWAVDFARRVLSQSGLQCTPTGFRKDLSVFVCDSYSDAHKDEILNFVAEGGGLLIGGHAWHFCYTHSLTDYPGNRLLSRMGVSLTEHTLDAGCYPKPWTGWGSVLPTMDLLRGVWEFDIRGSAVPGELLLHGPRAFRIGTDQDGRVFLAGAHYGQGRVIMFTHESYLGRQELAPFLHNALHWLDKGRRGLVGVQPAVDFARPVLSQSGLQCTPTGFRKDLSVFVCNSYSDEHKDEILNFVADGGGLLIGGHAWHWCSVHPGQSPLTHYPGNHLLSRMGVSLLESYLHAGCYPK